MTTLTNQLSPEEQKSLLFTLQSRFEKHKSRHKDIISVAVQAKLEASPAKMTSLSEIIQWDADFIR